MFFLSYILLPQRAVKVICMIKQLLQLEAAEAALRRPKLLLAASIIGTTLKRAHNDVEEAKLRPKSFSRWDFTCLIH